MWRRRKLREGGRGRETGREMGRAGERREGRGGALRRGWVGCICGLCQYVCLC